MISDTEDPSAAAARFSLAGKVALVTGATSGLGHRFARVLAGAGAAVAITGRRADRLETLKAGIEAGGGRAAAIALDVRDIGSIRDCIAATEGALGPLDILVNNAGMNIEAMAKDIEPDQFDTIMETNARGPFFMAQAAARAMMARGAPGRIVNIASIGAFENLPGLAAYCMSKAAVAMMTRAMAREWARAGINVTAICPGYIETELNAGWFASDGGKRQIAGFPRRRLGDASDLDGTLLLLCSDAGRGITGALFTVDDGQSL